MKTQEAQFLRVGEAARRLGLHPMTVRRWLKTGKITGVQVGREARISLREIERLVGSPDQGTIVLYGRVSGSGQRDDLATQLTTLREWAARERPQAPLLVQSDIGSGLKTERRSLQHIIGLVQERQIAEIVVTYADRLTRFGLAYLTEWFAGYGTRITTIYQQTEQSPEQELADDLIAIITSFSGRLYGMRSHKQQTLVACAQQVLQRAEEAPDGE